MKWLPCSFSSRSLHLVLPSLPICFPTPPLFHSVLLHTSPLVPPASSSLISHHLRASNQMAFQGHKYTVSATIHAYFWLLHVCLLPGVTNVFKAKNGIFLVYITAFLWLLGQYGDIHEKGEDVKQSQGMFWDIHATVLIFAKTYFRIEIVFILKIS